MNRLFFLLAVSLVCSQNITDIEWTVLNRFILATGCVTSLCTSIRSNQTCSILLACTAGGNVQQLLFGSSNLNGTLISELAQLTALQALNVSTNALSSTIPSQLAQLSYLTLLDLSRNLLVGTVPVEFDQSPLQTIVLHGNSLSGDVPFFPQATSCSLQTGDGNDFCCPALMQQQCCLPSACFCSNLPPCLPFAPVPNRCSLADDQFPPDINHALCMTEATLDSEAEFATSDGTATALLLVDNFTVAFWAQAREPLDYIQSPSSNGNTSLPRGCVFRPQIPPVSVGGVGIGFFLGTDGYTIQQHGISISSSIVVQRQQLFGWHHYAVVVDNRVPSVYIDGILSFGESALNLSNPMTFRAAFARTLVDDNRGPLGFEGWISEVQLANRSLLGSEALMQTSNASAWTFTYSMNGCEGENHTGTDIEQFQLQQAWLICETLLPTCGAVNNSFAVGDPAGCFCENSIQTHVCIAGIWIGNDTVVAQPVARWLLDNSTAVVDSSGHGFSGEIVGSFRVATENGTTFTSLLGTGYVEFGVPTEFNFGISNFLVEFWMRVNTSVYTVDQFLLGKRSGCVDDGWAVVLNPSGIIGITVAHSGGYVLANNVVSIRDAQWHFVQFTRSSLNVFELFLDKALVLTYQPTYLGQNVNSTGYLTFGYNENYCAMTFIGDVANVSIYVDLLPSEICSFNSATGYSASEQFQTAGYDQVVGFCLPLAVGSQCCAAVGCSQCTAYHYCNQYFDVTTTATVAANSATMMSLATSQQSTTTGVAANSTTMSLAFTGLSTALVGHITTVEESPHSISLAASNQATVRLSTLDYVGIILAIVAVVAISIGVVICYCVCCRTQIPSSSISLRANDGEGVTAGYINEQSGSEGRLSSNYRVASSNNYQNFTTNDVVGHAPSSQYSSIGDHVVPSLEAQYAEVAVDAAGLRELNQRATSGRDSLPINHEAIY